MKQLFAIGLLLTLYASAGAQHDSNYIRIARLIIDPVKLDAYQEALREHAVEAVRLEKGVIMLYAVKEKNNPAAVLVFEIYADRAAYETHIRQPHFLKYKDTVKDMVRSLELIDVSPIALESKLKRLQ